LNWAHLRVASAYSMRYGLAQPRELAERAAELGMDLLALTDRDGLYGAVKHVLACRQAGIGPILGTDLALAGRRDLAYGDASKVTVGRQDRVAVLASGRPGWESLCRLVSATHLSGERGRPVTSRELIAGHATGLVVLLGPGSDVGRAITARRPDLAARRLAEWRESAEVVVEVVDHHERGDDHRAVRMMALAREAGVPVILSNAVRYLVPGDRTAAQVLDVSRKLVPLHRRHLEDRTGHAYLKSGAEMTRVAEMLCGPDRDAARELLTTTRRLAERCVLDPREDLGLGVPQLPEVAGDAQAELRARCEAGIVRRGLDRPVRERMEGELDVIARKGLAAYFIVVADIAALIRAHGIRCAIRGSGAGSLVNHLIGISDVDPLEHGLLMERFLADSRTGLPDIDLDVESARRLEAYRLIIERYGEERVACVSMMETYRARSAIRDVGAAVGLPPHEIDTIAKTFPHVRAGQIGAALRDLPELRQSGLAQRRLAMLFRIAQRLDGLPRHIAMHPCGVLVSNATLLDRTPVERSFLGFSMSQYDKDDVEDMGLLKLDVLGVRMQSAMAHSVSEITRATGAQVDLEAIPRDDEPTYEMIRTSRTLGCFQIESPGQRELVAKLLPRDLNDLIIDISLFRPGPVNSDMITPYLDSRQELRPPSYPHPDLTGALRESLGVVVFHEQVLRIIDTMTGCGLSEAERLRRLLADEAGKAEVEAFFRQAAGARGYDPATLDRVWTTLTAFGAFGFCKAHAASFALPTYQSAWLKRHHPAAFYAGVLTHEPGLYPQRAILDDARHFGVPILPLDINHSAAHWQIEPALSAVPQPVERSRDHGRGYGIRVALGQVRGISDAELGRIVAGRPYDSLGDFWRRASVSRPVAERLVMVGAFDSLYESRYDLRRRDLLCQVGALDRAGGRLPRGVGKDQLPMLGVLEEIQGGELPAMTDAEVVEAELEILGMDVSRHVLSFYDGFLAELGVVRSTGLLERRADSEVLVAGVKVATQTPAVRSGQRIIFATVDDATGPVDATFFESVQDRCAATVFGSWLLVIQGRLRRTGDRAVSINATACWDLARLYDTWRQGGMEAVREVMAGAGEPRARGLGASRIIYANGFAMSPYADLTPAGTPPKRPPSGSWHVSPGSSGPSVP
jgi:error-prone DNA polymerase